MRDAYDNGHVAGDDVTVDDDSVDDDTSLNADNGADDAEAGVVSWFGRGRAATCMVNRLFAAADDDDDNDAMDASSSTTSSSHGMYSTMRRRIIIIIIVDLSS
jgi:hypothetical protein